ncbi:MAG TPA: hypothetical protein VGL54_05865 [Solirubrobacteraceae bacterium]
MLWFLRLLGLLRLHGLRRAGGRRSGLGRLLGLHRRATAGALFAVSLAFLLGTFVGGL